MNFSQLGIRVTIPRFRKVHCEIKFLRDHHTHWWNIRANSHISCSLFLAHHPLVRQVRPVRLLPRCAVVAQRTGFPPFFTKMLPVDSYVQLGELIMGSRIKRGRMTLSEIPDFLAAQGASSLSR